MASERSKYMRRSAHIEKMLSKAEYKFDESVKEWSGWIKGMPGIYAQKKRIEEVRRELTEMIEEHQLITV